MDYYSQLVDSYISKSGLSLAEIARRMNEDKGIKVDRSYISKLRNFPKYPATEEINRALAEVTNGDPEELILAAYLEKAPNGIKETLESYKETAVVLLLNALVNFLETFRQTGAIDWDRIHSIGSLSSLLQKLKHHVKIEPLYEDPEYAAELIKQLKYFFYPNLESLHFEKIYIDFKRYVDPSGNAIRNRNPYPLLVEKAFKAEEERIKNQNSEHKNYKQNEQHESSDTNSEDDKYDPSTHLVIYNSIGASEEKLEYPSASFAGFAFVDKSVLNGQEGFALKVSDDSMSGDRILEGDVAIIAKQKDIKSQDIAVVAIGNENAILRRIQTNGDMYILFPSNPNFETKVVHSSEVRILGKVVEVNFWPK